MRQWRRSAIRAWFMIGTALLVGGGFLAIKVYFDQFARDHELCIRGVEHGQTIVFIDKTDMWNPNQSERLLDHVLGVLNKDMKEEERLRVFSFGASIRAGFKPRYSACKPPDGGKCMGVFCNPGELAKQHKERFIDPLLKELEELKIATQGVCSPIVEALFDVLSRPEVKSQPGSTRLVLISDMAQNTPVYTAFRNQLPACPGVNAKADPDKDNGLLQYVEKQSPDTNISGAFGTVFQVFPERRTPEIGDRAKKKWSDVFQRLNVTMKWERL